MLSQHHRDLTQRLSELTSEDEGVGAPARLSADSVAHAERGIGGRHDLAINQGSGLELATYQIAE